MSMFVLTSEHIERLRDWAAILTSGNYAQITSKLKTPEGYCCLGVACEIAPLGHFRKNPSAVYTYLGSSTMPPARVDEWYLANLGKLDNLPIMANLVVTHDNGQIPQNYADYTTLSACNDNGAGFPAIADIIGICVDRIEANYGEALPRDETNMIEIHFTEEEWTR